MRRPPYHRSYHHSYHHRRHAVLARRPFGPLLLLLALVALAGGAALIGLLIAVVMVAAPLALAGAATMAIVASRRRRRRAVTHHPAGSPREFAAAPTVAVSPAAARTPDWAATRARFAQLRSEYGRFECDPLAVLRLPALADVTVPSTGRFVDAFAEAQALDTDTAPPPEHAARFATAVDGAWRAWRAARDAAERIRLAGVPAEERATVQRAIKLLTVAQDSSHDAERIAAYSRARAELAKLDRSGTLRLPPAAAAALDAAARGQLPAAATG